MKYQYMTNEYNSKLELMEANNLTSTQFDSLFKIGRIQMTTNDDIVDFSGLWLGKNRNNNNENTGNDE